MQSKSLHKMHLIQRHVYVCLCVCVQACVHACVCMRVYMREFDFASNQQTTSQEEP